MRGFGIILISLGLFLLFCGLLRYRQASKERLVKRLEFFSEAHRALPGQKGEKNDFRARMLAVLRKLSLFWNDVHKAADLDFRMQQADLPLLGTEFQTGLVVLGVLGATVGGILIQTVIGALLGALTGVIAGLMWLSIRIKRRQDAFVGQLGDMLTMVSNALRSGFSFMQAIELVAQEMGDPMSKELTKAIAEIRIGTSMDKALEEMARRMQSSDFELAVTAVEIQRQVGGNLAQILDTICETVENRVRMRREIATMTSQGRMSGMVLVVLPFVIAAALYFVNPGYLQPLVEDPTGRMAVGGAIVLEIIGCIVIKRIVDIKM